MLRLLIFTIFLQNQKVIMFKQVIAGTFLSADNLTKKNPSCLFVIIIEDRICKNHVQFYQFWMDDRLGYSQE